MPRNRTALLEVPYQQLFFVEEGEGRLDDGTQYWELRHGVAVLVRVFYFGRYTTPAPTNFREEEGKVPGKKLVGGSGDLR